MEVLIHFVFQLFKIGLLSVFYVFVFVQLQKRFNKNKPKIKIGTLKIVGYYLIAYVLLFVYSFTYWGNHGLGDGPRIPIGHWKVVENVNWQDSGYVDTKNGQLEMEKFLVKEGKLFGKYDNSFATNSHEFFILDLDSEELLEFESEKAYNLYVNSKDFPDSSELLNYHKNYMNRWGGIRFFLLP
ncbi:hypothetical protein [uncultured Tenacibaculum sp.]|uniref:hypothetical protein n=1 Tax=uncultured Tenacibaculum sp. TaxID=174713 RepID=UPI002636336B|nr:hypothetical protein [uncultured Tenacibaculum sp.]